jgi:hypothetical protein
MIYKLFYIFPLSILSFLKIFINFFLFQFLYVVKEKKKKKDSNSYNILKYKLNN